MTIEEFAAVDEPGAVAIVGEPNDALIPANGDVTVYGNGGAGKTTLVVDLAFHLATGKDWLGISVPVPVRVLLIENEGPRPMLRRKLSRKLAGWTGPPPGDRLRVHEDPWGRVCFGDEAGRERLASVIATHKVDVVIAGPVTRLGMDEAGTLVQVRQFMELVADVRRCAGRPVAVILVHHENKGGAVSGAWEGAGDTLVRVETREQGRTRLHVQKARWSTTHHLAKFDLEWTDGEGFAIKEPHGPPELVADVVAYVVEHPEVTSKEEIAKGLGKRADLVRKAVDQARREGKLHRQGNVWSAVRDRPGRPDGPTVPDGPGRRKTSPSGRPAFKDGRNGDGPVRDVADVSSPAPAPRLAQLSLGDDLNGSG